MSGALLSQVDFVATVAALVGQTLAADDAPDSLPMLPAVLGESRTGRLELVEQAGGIALRQGTWKYIEPNKRQRISQDTGIELGNSAEPQLYDLSQDPGETKNLAAEMPDRLRELAAELDGLKKAGRTRR